MYNNFQKAAQFRYRVGENNEDVKNATFCHIRKIYEMESSMAQRMAHKLNQMVMNPTNIQRSSAKLAMALFHDSTVAALKYYSENKFPEFRDTHHFVKLFSVVWSIII